MEDMEAKNRHLLIQTHFCRSLALSAAPRPAGLAARSAAQNKRSPAGHHNDLKRCQRRSGIFKKLEKLKAEKKL